MNRLFLLLFGAVSLVAHAQVPDYVPTEGLVAWYPFNGNANDESGNGNDGLVDGATLTSDRYGIANSAYNFDGNDHIEAQHQDWLNMGIGSTTWAGWGKKTSGNDHAHFFTKIEATSSPYSITSRYLRYGPNDNIEFAEGQSGSVNGGNSVNVYTTELLNEWIHLVGVKDSISGTMRIYQNGVLLGESAIQNEQSFDHSGSLFIGCEHPYISLPSGPQYFFGDLDDLGIWNRALTEGEILALYNAEPPAPGCTDPTACNFDAEATEDDGSCLLTFCNDTLYVPQDYPNVQQAVNASDDGDVIILAEGTHISGQTIEVENKSITVQGCCSAEDVILSGENSHRVLNVSGNIEDHTVFKNLTIAFGRPVPDDHASALKVNGCQATFFQVIIEQNGGGTGNTVAYGSGSGLTLFDRCIVRNNSVENYAGLRAAKVRKSILHNNVGWNNTGVLLDCESYNCTVYGNGGGAGNPWTSSGLSGGLARNCIFWNNSAQAAYNPESVEYSLNSGHTGEGNIDGDPMFLDANSGIFSLLPGSPAVDSGDPNPDYNDFDGSRNDMGAIALSENFYGPPGCTDSTACNFDAEATSDDGSCIPSGCMETDACNYNALAECEGEACDYSCCPGPGCCGDGMYWDYEATQCAIIENCQDDLDGDGVIGVNDLMQLLSSFGTDCAPAEEPETTEFTCGDPVSYHGYDYATVQIGEQCWFAENLRTELYRTGAPIPTLSSPEEWNATTIGARTRFGEWGTECGHDVEAFNACNPDLALLEFGYLYNWLAVDDVRALCPTDWHVPTESEWNELFDAVGGPGTASDALKSPEGWAFDGSGTQDIGFNAKPGAQRQITPLPWASAGAYGFWWSSSAPTASDAWGFKLSCFQDNVLLSVESQNIGRSIRCLKVQ